MFKTHKCSIQYQAYRWISDSRDVMTNERVSAVNDEFKLYRFGTYALEAPRVCVYGITCDMPHPLHITGVTLS